MNFQNQRIKYYSGLRIVILKRNKLGDKFGKELVDTVLSRDSYIRSIDLAANRLSNNGINTIVKLGLARNDSITSFDCRVNPGISDKLQH